jgi:hypothetical protein
LGIRLCLGRIEGAMAGMELDTICSQVIEDYN